MPDAGRRAALSAGTGRERNDIVKKEGKTWQL
ncbi:MAG: hypothetical protein GAK30_02787 [Paracidovorax wautersii]|uniref:Uncharacterized protein n=1 Tax=Paracidovorax wautersii TaxID=1177982 RepID=A0A7V8JPP2_9BURK|nr:MAG: hypothetical protein GAK30_02787 [Paracidovorax wautersii]